MYFSMWEASYQISHWLDIFMPTPWQWHRGHCSTESIMSNICRVCFFLFPVTLLDLSWEVGDSVVEVRHTKICIYSFRALGNYEPNWKVKNNPLLNNPTQKFVGALAGLALELLPFTANSVMDTIASHFQLEKLSTMFITPKKHMLDKWVNGSTCTGPIVVQVVSSQSGGKHTAQQGLLASLGF